MGGDQNVVDLKEALGEEVIAWRDGEPVQVPVSTLEGMYIGLYFSAHWCPPCRNFTPRLSSTYTKLREAKKPFEVVFISCDHDADQFLAYYSKMPWCASPFGNVLRSRLMSRFGISGIPALVIIGPDGKVLNRNARMAVLQDSTGESFPWEGQHEPWQFSPWLTILVIAFIWVIFKMFIDK